MLRVSEMVCPLPPPPPHAASRRLCPAGIAVRPIPGPSAVTAAVSVCGFAATTHGYTFLGFAPRTGAARAALHRWILTDTRPVVMFEAPHRLKVRWPPGPVPSVRGQCVRGHGLQDSLSELLVSLERAGQGARRVAVCRELTKLHEHTVVRTAAEVRARLSCCAMACAGGPPFPAAARLAGGPHAIGGVRPCGGWVEA